MRLRITFVPARPDACIPINYQYPLSSAIYKILAQAEPKYSAFLHDEGYPSSNNKRLKLFTFSRIFSETPAIVTEGALRWYGKPSLWFFLSSPMEETFIQNIIIGIFRKNFFTISRNNLSMRCNIVSVDPVPIPAWQESLACRCLGPMVMSTQDHDSRYARYLDPSDARFREGIALNLLRKYELLSGASFTPLSSIMEPDANYFKSRGGVARTSKLITIKEGAHEESRIRGYVFPFQLTAPRELFTTAWDCGLGEKNSIGFGMWDAAEPSEPRGGLQP